VKTIRGHSDWVRDVSPAYDGQWLVLGGNDHTAMIWDAVSREAKATLLGHENFIESGALISVSTHYSLKMRFY
jgi:platelet-activating factor acetylhydrolase IB subunit alpha